jgi:hypothetical protein
MADQSGWQGQMNNGQMNTGQLFRALDDEDHVPVN